MGRTGPGVEVRAHSIRFTFLPGRPTLTVNGEPAPPTPANVKWAHRLAAEMRERVRHGTFSMAEYFPLHGTSGTMTTVASQLDTWLGAQRIEASTRKTYGSAVAFWKTAPSGRGLAVGDLPLRGLLHSHVLTALASRPTLTGKSVNNLVSVLRGACALAVADHALTTNPVSEVKTAAYQTPPPDPFTQAEAEDIIAWVAKKHPGHRANYCEFKFFTGLRPSEAIALRWQNVDFRRAEMLISEACVLKATKDTKTNTARTVKLNSRALAALTRQKALTYLEGGAVFHDPVHGRAWADEKPWKMRVWQPCLKALGMRYRPPYNTRHTYATAMLMAGMRPAFCARQMGHDVKVFLEVYARWLDGEHDDLEMARLEAAFTSPALPRASEPAA